MSLTDAPNVQSVWARVQADIKAVGKDGRNQQQSYNFRGIDGVMNAVGPALRKHGVTITPAVVTRESSTVEVGKNRTPMRVVDVTVDYTVRGPAGDEFTGRVPGEAMDSGDKATSKAMSVAYRTFLIQALTLPTHEVDPDESSYERSPERPVARSNHADAGEWATPDPLADLKREVVAAAEKVGIHDRQSLALYYAEQNGGAVLTDADETALRAFLAQLTAVTV